MRARSACRGRDAVRADRCSSMCGGTGMGERLCRLWFGDLSPEGSRRVVVLGGERYGADSLARGCALAGMGLLLLGVFGWFLMAALASLCLGRPMFGGPGAGTAQLMGSWALACAAFALRPKILGRRRR